MKSEHFFVRLDSETITTFLVGYWYEDSRLFDRLSSIASSIPDSKFAENLSNHAIGQIICDEDKSMDKFNEFLDNSDVGKFLKLSPGLDFKVRMGALPRIRIDIGNHLKRSQWYLDKVDIFIHEKEKIKVIKKIMNA